MPKLRSELLRVENRMFQVWYEGASGYGWQEAGAAFVYTDGAHPIGNGCLSWSQPGGPCSPAGALSLGLSGTTKRPKESSVRSNRNIGLGPDPRGPQKMGEVTETKRLLRNSDDDKHIQAKLSLMNPTHAR